MNVLQIQTNVHPLFILPSWRAIWGKNMPRTLTPKPPSNCSGSDWPLWQTDKTLSLLLSEGMFRFGKSRRSCSPRNVTLYLHWVPLAQVVPVCLGFFPLRWWNSPRLEAAAGRWWVTSSGQSDWCKTESWSFKNTFVCTFMIPEFFGVCRELQQSTVGRKEFVQCHIQCGGFLDIGISEYSFQEQLLDALLL